MLEQEELYKRKERFIIKRPVLVALIGYIIGIIMGLYLKISIAFLYIPIIVILYLIKKLKRKKKNEFKILNPKRYFRYIKLFINKKVLITIIISSIISNTIIIYKNIEYVKSFKDKEIINKTAIVVSQKEEKDYNFTYKIKLIKKDEKNKYLYLKIDKKQDMNLEYGDKIFITGEFQEPQEIRNEGGFNYKEYLKSINIFGSIKATNVKIISKNQGNIFIDFTYKISDKIKENIENFMGEKYGGLLLGLLLGDSSKIDENIEENFKITSLTHILAVSGAQVSYIIIAMYGLLKRKIGIQKTRVVIIISLIFYMTLTGFSPSIVRAGIMGIILMMSGILFKKNDIMNSIAISLFLMLIYNPYLLENVGLQLSYLGTIGIIGFNKTIIIILKNIKIRNRKWKYKINRKLILFISKIKEMLAVTISASLAVMPVIIYHFNLFGTYFLITNLLASIIIGPITLFGTLLVIISFISINIAEVLSYILKFLIDILLVISNFSKLPISKIYIPTPKIIVIIVIYLLTIVSIFIYKIFNSRNPNNTQIRFRNLIALLKYKFNQNRNKVIKRILIICSIISLVIIFIPKDLKINFVDVGQGDSTFIITPKNRTILIDGGGSNTSSFDVGKNTLLPYILDKGYNKIDLMIISHFDSDHIGGLFTILEEIKVNKVLIAKQDEQSENYKHFLNIVKEKNIQVIVGKRGDKINIEKNIYLDIIFPEKKQIGENVINNNSLVFNMHYNNFSMLFTGDIEEIAEKRILEITSKNKLKADIIKIPHHGSKTSSTRELLERVLPQIALIGVGKDNLFGHPSSETIDKLDELKIKTYRTDINGEIMINVNKSGIRKIKTIY